MSRLIDIDRIKDVPGKTQVVRWLDNYEKENPLTEIVVQQGEWEITMVRKAKHDKD